MGTMYTALNTCKTVEMSSPGWTQAVTPYMTKCVVTDCCHNSVSFKLISVFFSHIIDQKRSYGYLLIRMLFYHTGSQKTHCHTCKNGRQSACCCCRPSASVSASPGWCSVMKMSKCTETNSPVYNILPESLLLPKGSLNCWSLNLSACQVDHINLWCTLLFLSSHSSHMAATLLSVFPFPDTYCSDVDVVAWLLLCPPGGRGSYKMSWELPSACTCSRQSDYLRLRWLNTVIMTFYSLESVSNVCWLNCFSVCRPVPYCCRSFSSTTFSSCLLLPS